MGNGDPCRVGSGTLCWLGRDGRKSDGGWWGVDYGGWRWRDNHWGQLLLDGGYWVSQPGWGQMMGEMSKGVSILGKVRKRGPFIEEVSRGVNLWRWTAGDPIVSKDNGPSRAGRSEKMRATDDDVSQEEGALMKVNRDGGH